jgi:hypothetical protein
MLPIRIRRLRVQSLIEPRNRTSSCLGLNFSDDGVNQDLSSVQPKLPPIPYKTWPSPIRRTCGSPIAHGLLSAHLQRLRKCSKITRAPAIGPTINAALVHHGSSFQVGRPLVSNMDSSSTTTQQRNAASHLNAGIRHYRNDWKSLVASIKLSARCHVNIAKESRHRTSSRLGLHFSVRAFTRRCDSSGRQAINPCLTYSFMFWIVDFC